jgi:L-lactate dehydrogenase complex protein LldG
VNARDAVLAAVRSALAAAPQGRVEVVRAYRDLPDPAEVLDLFVGRVEDYRATVVRCSPSEVPATLAGLVAGRSFVVPPGLPWAVPGQQVDTGLGSTALDAVDAVVTASAVAVAATGTIVLDHRPDQGRRALSLVPDVHVCVVRADQVVASVPQAVARLDPRRPQTWISGPSATSDIELSRVEGVHGPRTLVVVLVDDDHA